MNKILLLILIFLIFNNREYFTTPSKADKLDSIICNRLKGTKINKDTELQAKWCDYFSLINKFQDRKFKEKNFKQDYVPYSKIGFTCTNSRDCGQGYDTDNYFCDKGKCNLRNTINKK